MTNMQDIRNKSDKELTDVVDSARETLREERFKDKLGRKASIIKKAKLEIARALSELTARRRNPEIK